MEPKDQLLAQKAPPEAHQPESEQPEGPPRRRHPPAKPPPEYPKLRLAGAALVLGGIAGVVTGVGFLFVGTYPILVIFLGTVLGLLVHAAGGKPTHPTAPLFGVLCALLCMVLANAILWLFGVSSWIMVAGSAASLLAAGVAAKTGTPARFAGR